MFTVVDYFNLVKVCDPLHFLSEGRPLPMCKSRFLFVWR